MAAILKRARGDDLPPFDEDGARLRVMDAILNGMPQSFRDDLAAAAISLPAEKIARAALRGYEEAARAERVREEFRPAALAEARAQRKMIRSAIRETEKALAARREAAIGQLRIAEYVAVNGVVRRHPDALDLDVVLAALHAEAEKIEFDIRALDGRERPPSRLRLLGNALGPAFFVSRPKGLIGVGPAFERYIAGVSELLTGNRADGQLLKSVAAQVTSYK